MPSSAELLALGEQTYERQCLACHGAEGDGEGEAAYLLYPRPRDFTVGRYRLVSTWDTTPTDEDLFRTISRGMPGSSMPSWAHLSEQTRWGLVHYIKRFTTRDFTAKPDSDPPSFGASGTGIIRVPPEPPYTDDARARANELYAMLVAPASEELAKGLALLALLLFFRREIDSVVDGVLYGCLVGFGFSATGSRRRSRPACHRQELSEGVYRENIIVF